MRYDAKEVRDSTLRDVRRSEIKSTVFLLIGAIILYVVGAFYFFLDNNPKMTLKEAIQKHPIDALMFNDIKN